jgi:hypothetical protein
MGNNNMKVGKKFMENLTDEQLHYWINDAVSLHSVDSLRIKKMVQNQNLKTISKKNIPMLVF